jgi:hypothetical protein
VVVSQVEYVFRFQSWRSDRNRPEAEAADAVVPRTLLVPANPDNSLFRVLLLTNEWAPFCRKIGKTLGIDHAAFCGNLLPYEILQRWS